MATTTENLKLVKPDYTDSADVGVINGNFDLIDQAIAEDRKQIVRSRNVWNLLDNSDFRNPVNQRGQSSYAGVSDGNAYTIDRWYYNWQGNGILTVGDGYIQSNGVKFQQYLTGHDATKPYTAAICLADGTIYVYSGVPADGFGVWDGTLWVSSPIEGDIVFRIEKGITQPIIWAALYEGEYTAENLPPYVPKGYAAELAECLRYFERKYYHLFGNGTSNMFFSLQYSRKRIYPTISAINTDMKSDNVNVANEVWNATPTSAGGLLCTVSDDGHTAYWYGSFDISADL